MRFLAPDPMGRVAVKRLKFCVTSSISHLIIAGLESRQEFEGIAPIPAWPGRCNQNHYSVSNLRLGRKIQFKPQSKLVYNIKTCRQFMQRQHEKDVVSYYKRIDLNNKCLLLSLCQRIMKFIIQTKLPQLCPLVANITCEILTSFTNPCWYILPL